MSLRITVLCTAFNGLSQRAWCELRERGHILDLVAGADGEAMQAAVERFKPDLIVAPMLKSAIPEAIWRRHICLIVHPGIVGDRGPSSLDWALLEGEREWGVTVLQADAEMDAGDIWATQTFAMRAVSKSQLYRHEVTDAASDALLAAVERFERGEFRPRALDYGDADVRGRLRPSMRPVDRAVDWEMGSAEILRRVRCGDSYPGARGRLAGREFQLFGAAAEPKLRGRPGALIAQRDGAVCIGSGDGAVWISHLRLMKGAFKLPATLALGAAALVDVPERALSPFAPEKDGPREILYREADAIGYLHFDFYNGAMSSEQCDRLRMALVQARQRPVRTLVLQGGQDIWSNGIHLNTIEAAADPALESWRNILAMNALVREIIHTDTQRVVAAMHGNAGAGGAILALAADEVWARSGTVLNPHYKGMGGLYGSEYWTYLLPRRVGSAAATELTEALKPVTAGGAEGMGMIDAAFGDDVASFDAEVLERAHRGNGVTAVRKQLAAKRERRIEDERRKPLESYAAEELAHMYRNFFGEDRSYHEARRRFVWKCALPVCEVPEVDAAATASEGKQEALGA
ncbi:enoyl-CoA hydratase-related protein [Solilutibacter silvestris]|uniref:Formyl transferase n=1 Tax=Solilutibacter silvestris TaxID=1645665 RepID=A0A2K1PY46_9GAMM|nr:enoyl-CoA hydratase-related protein [Lysobacter silvestris]PNS07712.1 Formyl transferase [Lysobacter silvestris]